MFETVRNGRLRLALAGWKAPLGVAFVVVGLYTWWCVKGAPGSDYQSAQWTYSAVFQGSAALIGLAALAVTVLWGQAVTSRAALAALIRRYADRAFERTNVELHGTKLSRIIVFINQIGGAIKNGTAPSECDLGSSKVPLREVFLDLNRYAYSLSWYSRDARLPLPIVRGALKDLGYKDLDVHRAVLIASGVDRLDPYHLFLNQVRLFGPNLAFATLPPEPHRDFYWEIFYRQIEDGVLIHVGRVQAFERFKRAPLAVTVVTYVGAMSASLLALGRTTASWHSPVVLAASSGLALISALVTAGYVLWLGRLK
jgi:hypothetical protein